MIIALAGRRIDPPNPAIVRFPAENSSLVQQRLLELFRKHEVTTLVAAASCGADILALEAAESLGLQRIIVLPYAVEEYRTLSVTDRPGDWGKRYDRITEEVEARNNLFIVQSDAAADDYDRIFTLGNTAILEKALEAARNAERATGKPEAVLAVIIWEGQSRGANDITENFANQARERDIPVVEILTY